MQASEEFRVARGASVVSADIGEEAVVLNIDSGYFHQLNKPAAMIWSLLETPVTLSALCARLEETFEVGSATCRSDVLEFIEQMLVNNLVEVGRPSN